MQLVSLLLLALAAVCRPTLARCPPGRDLRTGIRRDGHFECWSRPIAPTGWPAQRLGPVTDWDGTWQRPERSEQRDDQVEARLWCGRGAAPIVVDERTVACSILR